MSDQLEMSTSIGELATALALAQGEIKAAAKDRDNPFFKSRYATLDAIWDAGRGPLSSHGLSIVQGVSATAPAEGPASVTVTTLLMHTSGQWISCPLTLIPKDSSPQAAGSAITYAKRYGLGAMVGITAEEDDDGNAAQPTRKADPRAFMKPPKVMASVEEIGKPDRPQTEPADHVEESRALFVTPEEAAERDALVKEATRLAKVLKLTALDKAGLKTEYLGGADVFDCDLSALATMVAKLKSMEPK